jgi:hexosaminidase
VRRFCRWGVVLAVGVFAVSGCSPDGKTAGVKSENVMLVLVDGLRRQEVFTGADESLMNKEQGGVQDVEALKAAYWRSTPEARREVLMPFMWGVVAKEGQIFGNPAKGSIVHVTNGHNFSYPGYSEMIIGFADPRIDSNDKRPNPNVTVLEWLHHKPRFQGKVAAFAAWDTVPYILNRDRCGFYVNAGMEPMTGAPVTPDIELLNRLKSEIPPRWGGEPFDALTFHSAMAYFQQQKPRVFYLAFGETDEWAHEGLYKGYLDAARLADSYIRSLWEAAQSAPSHRGKTTMIIVTDHGRGDEPKGWRNHGRDTTGSEYVWVAVLGPDTAALGERSNTPAFTLSQVAATLAAAVGEDYCAGVPDAAKPFDGAIGTVPKQAQGAASPSTQPPAPAIIPQPMAIETRPGAFALGDSTAILVSGKDSEVGVVAEYLAMQLRESTGLSLAVKEAGAGQAALQSAITLSIATDASLGDEGYELAVESSGVSLKAAKACGLFRGTQTVRQLLSGGGAAGNASGPWPLSAVRIIDRPRYPWRGMLLDCGRHFMTKDFVKRYIDLLAYHKMNVLHWHLTDDQGWRIEIKKYPKLTEIGAWRGKGKERYGGFYTQEDVREIVAYAKSRYVTIVPEIEMPGHSLAALASHPELSCTGGPFSVGTQWGVFDDVYCAGSDSTFEFLQEVLSEVIALFPSEYIHIGGDECPKVRWEKCPRCQARLKAEGLKDERELQSYFIHRIEKFLNDKGRRLIGWDEILEGGLAPNATVQSWRGMDGAVTAAKSGHGVIASPTSHCYLDYAQEEAPGEMLIMGFLPIETVYSFEPTPAGLTPEQALHVLGAEGNIWTEHAPQARVDHQVFPRLCALAEVTWSPKAARKWDDFDRRMRVHYRRLDAMGVTYFIPVPKFRTANTAFTDEIEIAFEPPFMEGEIRFTTDGEEPTLTSTKYSDPLRLTEATVVKARNYLRDGRTSDVTVRRFRKMRPVEAVQSTDSAPGLAYEYYEGTWGRIPDFSDLRPAATGVAQTVDLSMSKRSELFAVRFSGYLSVPEDGRYTFWLNSDDGSRLTIGSDVVIDHDGPHSSCEKSGQIILKAGRHPIRVEFFDGGGANSLSLAYEGPNVAKQPIPAAAFSHHPVSG